MSVKTTFWQRYISYTFDGKIGNVSLTFIVSLTLSIISITKSTPTTYNLNFFGEAWGWTIVFVILFIVFTYFLICLLLILGGELYSLFKEILISRIGYGDAIIYLHHAFQNINLLKLKSTKLSAEEVKTELTIFCTTLKDLYEKRTKSRCCVSIHLFKELQSDNKMFTSNVFNFIRDKDCSRNDKNYQDFSHTVHENTCYEEIVKNLLSKDYDQLFYINNDLPSDIGYQSTSLAVKEKHWGMKFEPTKKHKVKHRRKNWYLDYRSEIVVPILPSSNQNDYFLLGFFCIDCKKQKSITFNRKYDVPLLQGVVDGIYDIIYNNIEVIY